MTRKLKTYQTSLGFFDLAIAVPSMKAALEAWGADSNLFHQGAARESDDPDVIAATLKRPGVVLKRPVGSDGAFNEQASLPANLGSSTGQTKSASKSNDRKAKKPPSRPIDKAAERSAALAYEREKQRNARELEREEAARQKERERRKQAIDKAQAAGSSNSKRCVDMLHACDNLVHPHQIHDASRQQLFDETVETAEMKCCL